MHNRKLLGVWEACFRFGLTRPSFVNLLVVLSGWTLTHGPHAVTSALVATGVAGRLDWSAFHRFFSRGTWSPDQLGRNVLAQFLADDADAVGIVIDDTLAPKKGPRVFGIGSHLDAVRSTKRRLVFQFGHCWVVLAVLVRVPFSARVWALPVLFRLYRNRKECAAKGAAYKRKTDLARELLDVFATWTRAARIEVAADSAYCVDTVTRGLSERFVLFGSMRPDAVLTDPPKAIAERGPGRPSKRGKPLPKPDHLARDASSPWQEAKARLYGREVTVRFKTMLGQWYRATGDRLLRIVVVECQTGLVPYRVFFSFDSTLTPVAILEAYAGRWAIEVFFREGKQLLGFADSQARTQGAVERVAPLVGLLYSSLVVWFADGVHQTTLALPPLRPWYPHKRGLCFADILRAAQRALATQDILDPVNHSNDLRELRHFKGKRREKPDRRVA